MRDKLVLLTNGYPYGKGEKTFVEPELNQLREHYDITVCTMASDAEVNCEVLTSDVSQDIRVIRYQPASKALLITYAIKYIFDSAAIADALDIAKGGENVLPRLRDSIGSYISACSIRDYLINAGLVERADETIFYSYWLTNTALALAFLKRQFPDLVAISRTHGYDLYNERNRFGRQPFQSYKGKALDRIYFISEQGRQYFREHFTRGDLSERYALNRLGVDIEDDSIETTHSSQVFRIVSCSNVIPVKRVPLLAEAVSKLGVDDYEWVHFGDGSDMSQVMAIAEERNIHLRIMGHVDNGAIIDFYRNNHVDVFVNVSSSEGCPVSIMEAMAFGIPIVGTAVGGVPEMIDENGCLLPTDPTPEEIAAALRGIREQDAQTTNTMRQASKDIYKRDYRQKRNAERFIESLQAL